MKFTIAHIFCGIGGKALGAAAAVATHGDAEATFQTIGGIDVDPLACRDFEMLTGAPSLCADVHDLEPADLRRFFGRTAPDVVMMSPPCKGFSGLLSAKRAAEAKYQRMNKLMERAVFLVCATWKRPPKLVFIENVPRIQSRGRDTIRRCVAIGHAHGFAVAQGNHDCGELGGLAQHRRRYFQLWRHMGAVPQMVYEPPKLRVRACGEVLGPLPMPGDVAAAGPMHSIPRLSWRNWVRLALIPAGGDWRDLPGTLIDGEARRDKFRRAPVTAWDAAAETVTGPGGSQAANVADPRIGLPPSDGRHWNKYAASRLIAEIDRRSQAARRVATCAREIRAECGALRAEVRASYQRLADQHVESTATIAELSAELDQAHRAGAVVLADRAALARRCVELARQVTAVERERDARDRAIEALTARIAEVAAARDAALGLVAVDAEPSP